MNYLNRIIDITSSHLNVSINTLCETTHLKNDLNIDSIDLMMLVLKLEEDFDTEIIEGFNIETISDFVYAFEHKTLCVA